MSRVSLVGGAFLGFLLALLVFYLANQAFWLPRAREEGRERLIAEQAVQSQKEELERKGDDAKLQRMSDFDLCIAYLGRVPECDGLRLQSIQEK